MTVVMTLKMSVIQSYCDIIYIPFFELLDNVAVTYYTNLWNVKSDELVFKIKYIKGAM